MILAGLAIGAHASATFDLMYLPSSQTNRVLRYDPVNRLALGGFVAPGARSVHNRGSQFGLVDIGAGPYAYNFFSGTNSGYIPVNAHGITASGAVYRFSPTTLDFFSLPSGSAVGGVNLAANTYVGGTVLGSNHIVGISTNGANLDLSVFNPSGSLISTNNLFLGGTVSYVSAATTYLDRFNTQTVVFVASVDGGPMRLFRAQYANNGAFLSSVGAFLLQHSSASAVGVASNHAGYYVFGADAATPTNARFVAYDNDGSGVQYDSWTESSLDLRNPRVNAYSAGMVLAPEPGEWLAMSMGLGALLVRRKRRSKSS